MIENKWIINGVQVSGVLTILLIGYGSLLLIIEIIQLRAWVHTSFLFHMIAIAWINSLLFLYYALQRWLRSDLKYNRKMSEAFCWLVILFTMSVIDIGIATVAQNLNDHFKNKQYDWGLLLLNMGLMVILYGAFHFYLERCRKLYAVLNPIFSKEIK